MPPNLEELVIRGRELDGHVAIDLSRMNCLKKLTLTHLNSEDISIGLNQWPPNLIALDLTECRKPPHEAIKGPPIPPRIKISYPYPQNIEDTKKSPQVIETRPPANYLGATANSLERPKQPKTGNEVTVRHVIYRQGSQNTQEAIPLREYRQHIKTRLQGAEGKLSLTKAPCMLPPQEQKQLTEVSEVSGFSQSEIDEYLAQKHYVGVFPLHPLQEWVPLPMLAPGDKMLGISKPADCQLRYNPDAGQYEIQWQGSDSEARVQYLFVPEDKVSTAKYNAADLALPAEVCKKLDQLFSEDATLPPTTAVYFLQLRKAIQQLRKNSNNPQATKKFIDTLCLLFRKFNWQDEIDESESRYATLAKNFIAMERRL